MMEINMGFSNHTINEKKHSPKWTPEEAKKVASLKKIKFYVGSDPNDALSFIKQQNNHVRSAIMRSLEKLDALGIKAQRPLVGKIEKNLYELRVKIETINYRLIYFFDGNDLIIVVSGITKEDKIPESEKLRAKRIRDEYFKKG